MSMTIKAVMILIVCAVCTMLTRVLPFVVFSGKHPIPKVITYLGKVLPPTIIATLVIYCIRNVDILHGQHGIAELIGISTAAILHLKWRNTLVSLGVSTVLYMILIRCIPMIMPLL